MKYTEFESSFLEFKREVPKNDQIIKIIIGFCNRYGGTLLIGVDCKKGSGRTTRYIRAS